MANLTFSLVNRTPFSMNNRGTSSLPLRKGPDANLMGRIGQLSHRFGTGNPRSMGNLKTKVNAHPVKYNSLKTNHFSWVEGANKKKTFFSVPSLSLMQKPPFASAGGILPFRGFSKLTHANVDLGSFLFQLHRIGLSLADLSQVVERVTMKNKNPRATLIPFVNPLTGNLLSQSAGISTGTVGDVPKEWQSNIFHWGREDDQAFLLAFVNSAYEPGIGITGLQAGDWILVKEAARTSATFAKDKGAFGKQAMISLLASAAQGGIAHFAKEWQDAINPIIQTGQQLAAQGFKGTNEGTKQRDLYGRDPGTGKFQCQEGGVVIALPSEPSQDLSNIKSGDDSDSGKKRWIKRKAPRTDALIPNHLHDVFFPIPGDDMANMRQINHNGVAWVMPWDYKFSDNAGYYAVHILVSKVEPVIEDVNLLNNLL